MKLISNYFAFLFICLVQKHFPFFCNKQSLGKNNIKIFWKWVQRGVFHNSFNENEVFLTKFKSRKRVPKKFPKAIVGPKILVIPLVSSSGLLVPVVFLMNIFINCIKNIKFSLKLLRLFHRNKHYVTYHGIRL
jgi:hypothetical protein